MTKKGSIKETGEEVSDENWQRFEAAVGIDKTPKNAGTVETDQPYREEAKDADRAGGSAKADSAGKREAGKTTKRTE